MPNSEGPSQMNRARRHFLGLAAATGGRIAALGVLASSVLPAWAGGSNWGKGRGGKGGKGDGSLCFLRGTAILTANGEVRVEDLRAGDLVRTVTGETVAIRWIGRQTFKRTGQAWQKDVLPIRIARHALDDKTPHTDLYVSPYHALYIDGALIRAKDLVNGSSITPALPAGRDTIEYYNLLLPCHGVVLAEGAGAESFRPEGGNHEAFANFAEFERLVPVAQRVQAPFAPMPTVHGRDHLKGLLRLGVRPFAPARDLIGDAQLRLADRARALAG